MKQVWKCRVDNVEIEIPVVNGDELEEILTLPLAGHVDHHGARCHAVGGQAGDESLQHPQLSWTNGQHCLSETAY